MQAGACSPLSGPSGTPSRGRRWQTQLGSGSAEAKELKARAANLAISGSGNISATLDGGPLAASIDGSGDIDWYGKAQVEVANVSGSGAIRHR